jgi:hypothetical protein
MLIFIKAPGNTARAISFDCGNQTLTQILEKHKFRANKAFCGGKTVHLDTILDATFKERLIEIM